MVLSTLVQEINQLVKNKKLLFKAQEVLVKNKLIEWLNRQNNSRNRMQDEDN